VIIHLAFVSSRTYSTPRRLASFESTLGPDDRHNNHSVGLATIVLRHDEKGISRISIGLGQVAELNEDEGVRYYTPLDTFRVETRINGAMSAFCENVTSSLVATISVLLRGTKICKKTHFVVILAEGNHLMKSGKRKYFWRRERSLRFIPFQGFLSACRLWVTYVRAEGTSPQTIELVRGIFCS
jgi:hypothetical protein